MYHMKQFLHNENGLTLIELLAATVITIFISIFAFTVLVQGINNYNRISTDTALRDEADYLMASLVAELYTTKETQITELSLPQANTNNYYLMIKKPNTPKKTGFENGNLLIQNQVISLQNRSITISNESYIEKIEDGLYKINLTLQLKNNKKITFENEITTINDKEEN